MPARKVVKSKPTVTQQRAAYKVLVATCGIAVGDYVKVVRPFVDNESGCLLEFDEDWMDDMVGQSFEVTQINGDGDFELDGGDGGYWPFFCLLKESAAIKLNEQHTAVIIDGGKNIKVGCQVFSSDKVIELYNILTDKYGL